MASPLREASNGASNSSRCSADLLLVLRWPRLFRCAALWADKNKNKYLG